MNDESPIKLIKGDNNSGTQNTYVTRQESSPLQNPIQVVPLEMETYLLDGQEFQSNFDPPLSSDEEDYDRGSQKKFSAKN